MSDLVLPDGSSIWLSWCIETSSCFEINGFINGLRYFTSSYQLLKGLSRRQNDKFWDILLMYTFFVRVEKVLLRVDNVVCTTGGHDFTCNPTTEDTLQVSPSPSRNRQPPSVSNPLTTDTKATHATKCATKVRWQKESVIVQLFPRWNYVTVRSQNVTVKEVQDAAVRRPDSFGNYSLTSSYGNSLIVGNEWRRR